KKKQVFKRLEGETYKMKHKLLEHLSEAKKRTSPEEKTQVAMGLMRIALQHACISVAEELIHLRKTKNANTLLQPLPLGELREPSDGELVAVLDQLLMLAEI